MGAELGTVPHKDTHTHTRTHCRNKGAALMNVSVLAETRKV